MAGLRTVIEGLSQRPGVAAVALVSDDGLVIDRAMGDGHSDPDEVAALSATLAQHATHLGDASGRGSFHAGVFEYANGMVVLSQAGPANFVVIVVDPDHNVGALLYHLREDESALAALL
jgi:predicted regulator of Ras-like GTPase activity (Roadblock/LC7/MglB family)